MPPPSEGTLTPELLNQMSSPGRVTNITAQNIHLVNPPPIAKFTRRRRLIPASTRHKSAAEGARSIITFAMSVRSCGVCIANFLSPFWLGAGSLKPGNQVQSRAARPG